MISYVDMSYVICQNQWEKRLKQNIIGQVWILQQRFEGTLCLKNPNDAKRTLFITKNPLFFNFTGKMVVPLVWYP